MTENISKLERWIIETFASSSFNKCENQPLPLMKGSPPLVLHIDESVKPTVISKPAIIPAHWRDQVKHELERDCRLGVLQRVPANTPDTWCCRMGVVGKRDGAPRRVIDMRPLNKATIRQQHTMDSPFLQASRVDPNTWRTTLDAWSGYHSVPLDKSSRHLTTFITPWGRYRYLVSPQGHKVSGDSFNWRYDQIIRYVQRVSKIVDDSLLWDATIEQHFFRVCEYLHLTG